MNKWISLRRIDSGAWLAQLAKHATPDLRVISSSPGWGTELTLKNKKKRKRKEKPIYHKVLHFLYFFWLVLSLPYKEKKSPRITMNHSIWPVHGGMDEVKIWSPHQDSLSPKGSATCEWNSLPSWELGTNQGRWGCRSSYHPLSTNAPCFPRVNWERPPKKTAPGIIWGDCMTVKAIKPCLCLFLFSIKKLVGTCFPHVAW